MVNLMKRIVLRLKVFGISCIVVMISIALLIYSCNGSTHSDRQIVIAVIIINLVSGIFLLIMSYRQYLMLLRARLIIENQLLHIPATNASDESKAIDIYFSCFGMLLGDKVIPFDAGNEKLHSMYIDENSVTITYGRENCKKTVELSKYLLADYDLNYFTEKLNFETGVMVNHEE